jgi:hypothetical protein
MKAALARHDEILRTRSSVPRVGSQDDGDGSRRCCDHAEALGAAVAMQPGWSERSGAGPLRVRIGVHLSRIPRRRLLRQ